MSTINSDRGYAPDFHVHPAPGKCKLNRIERFHIGNGPTGYLFGIRRIQRGVYGFRDGAADPRNSGDFFDGCRFDSLDTSKTPD